MEIEKGDANEDQHSLPKTLRDGDSSEQTIQDDSVRVAEGAKESTSEEETAYSRLPFWVPSDWIRHSVENDFTYVSTTGNTIKYHLDYLQRLFVTLAYPTSSKISYYYAFAMNLIVIFNVIANFIGSTGNYTYQPDSCEVPACDNDATICPGKQICAPVAYDTFMYIDFTCWLIYSVDIGLRISLCMFMPSRILKIIPNDWDEWNNYRHKSKIGMVQYQWDLITRFCKFVDHGLFNTKYRKEIISEVEGRISSKTMNIKGADDEIDDEEDEDTDDDDHHDHDPTDVSSNVSIGLEEPNFGPVTKLVRYCLSSSVLIDLFATLPVFVLIFLNNPSKPWSASGSEGSITTVRIAKCFRLLRVLEVHPDGSPKINIIVNSILNSMTSLTILFGGVVISAVILGSIIYSTERGKFRVTEEYPDGDFFRESLNQEWELSPFNNLGACIYWALVTMSTLGYGDLYPTSTLGRTIGAFACIYGVIIISIPVTIINNQFGEESNKYKAAIETYAKQYKLKRSKKLREQEKEKLLLRRESLKAKNIHTEYDPKSHQLILVSTQQHTRPMSFFSCAGAQEEDVIAPVGFSSISSSRLSINASSKIVEKTDPMTKLREEITAIQERMAVVNNLLSEIDRKL